MIADTHTVERIPPSTGLFGAPIEGEGWRKRVWNRIVRAIGMRWVRRAAPALERGDRAALQAIIDDGRRVLMAHDHPGEAHWAEAAHGLTIGGPISPAVRARWVKGPSLRHNAALIYVPGGSFIAERSPRVTAMIYRVAKAARLRTLMCDYRLAPEYPCPAAIEDVTAAIEATLEDGLEPDRIALIAESAGAAIALAAAQRLRAKGTRLAAMVFFSPWTDLTLSGASIPKRVATGDAAFGADAMSICARIYLQGRATSDPIASPVFGPLNGLAPMLIHTSRTDSLHDDAALLAERSAAAGVPVTLRIWPTGNHVFERFYGPAAGRSLADAAAFLRAQLPR